MKEAVQQERIETPENQAPKLDLSPDEIKFVVDCVQSANISGSQAAQLVLSSTQKLVQYAQQVAQQNGMTDNG